MPSGPEGELADRSFRETTLKLRTTGLIAFVLRDLSEALWVPCKTKLTLRYHEGSSDCRGNNSCLYFTVRATVRDWTDVV